ncbi:MAG: hypothetical protein ACK41W_05070 [Cyanobacteriota bacterium]|jgi:hypothetical protein
MPTTTNIDYAAALDIQHYIVPLKMSAIVLEDAEAASAGGSALTSWLNTANAISGQKVVTANGAGTTFQMFVDSAQKTVTNAALASNVVTLTLDAALEKPVGSTINVSALPAPFAAIAGNFVVTAVTTISPFTVSFNFTGSNIASASVAAGTVTTGVYPLDGTGKPIQLLNVTSAPHGISTADETVITHDQVTRGAAITVGITDTHSFSFSGMTAHKNVDHKVMQVLSERATAERLGVKYLRVGPGGTVEKKLCYGRFSSKTEEGDAGALVKYSATLNVLGAVYTIPDNS